MKKLPKNAALLAFIMLLAACFPTVSAESSAFSAGTQIRFDGNSARILGAGASFKKGTLTISEAGVYLLSGTLSEGRILVKAPEDAKVELIFDGVTAFNSQKTVLHIKEAGQVTLLLAADSENLLTGPEKETDENNDPDAGAEDGTDKAPAVIRSSCPVLIRGEGSLTVTAPVGRGLQLENAVFESGNIRIRSGGDSIRTKGDFSFEGGSLTAESAEDAVQASGDILISGGSLNVLAGGGSQNAPAHAQEPTGRFFGGPRQPEEDKEDNEESSQKGLKADGDLRISGGTVILDTADDALHCAGELCLSGGTVRILSGDDGLHSDTSVTVSGGTLDIQKSFEGIEGSTITISGGDLSVCADDDGVNASSGEDALSFGFMGGPGDFARGGGERGGRGPRNGGGRPDGFGAGEDREKSGGFPEDGQAPAPSGQGSSLPCLLITGGTLHVIAEGDGLDSNGDLCVSGGTVIVDGPSSSGNGALDSGSENGGSLTVTGGTVLAIGAAGMSECFGAGSLQASVALNAAFSAGDEIRICDQSGGLLFTHTAVKRGQSIIFSCPGIREGDTLILRIGENEYTAQAQNEHMSGPFGRMNRR